MSVSLVRFLVHIFRHFVTSVREWPIYVGTYPCKKRNFSHFCVCTPVTSQPKYRVQNYKTRHLGRLLVWQPNGLHFCLIVIWFPITFTGLQTNWDHSRKLALYLNPHKLLVVFGESWRSKPLHSYLLKTIIFTPTFKCLRKCIVCFQMLATFISNLGILLTWHS